MSVLIEGMKMPENTGINVTIYPDGRVVKYHGPYSGKEVIGTAAELGPHGKLIDADALQDELTSSDEDICFKCMLEEAQAVIEAEY